MASRDRLRFNVVMFPGLFMVWEWPTLQHINCQKLFLHESQVKEKPTSSLCSSGAQFLILNRTSAARTFLSQTDGMDSSTCARPFFSSVVWLKSVSLKTFNCRWINATTSHKQRDCLYRCWTQVSSVLVLVFDWTPRKFIILHKWLSQGDLLTQLWTKILLCFQMRLHFNSQCDLFWGLEDNETK